MFTKRIIPCLDVNKGRVVKGVNFVNLRDAGDPVEIAKIYDAEGADELVFLDITASNEARDTVVDMVRAVAANVFIPFTVGGGIRTIEDFRRLLREGADKISVNSAAIDRPELIGEAAEKFGSQCVVVAIDAKRRADGSGWKLLSYPGRMACTNYLGQSVFGIIIFYGIGFGLGGKVGLLGTTLIALAVYAFQVCFSHLWMKHFAFGPVEWVWRMLTYGKILPIKKLQG